MKNKSDLANQKNRFLFFTFLLLIFIVLYKSDNLNKKFKTNKMSKKKLFRKKN